jgi:micrococcal nuclease
MRHLHSVRVGRSLLWIAPLFAVAASATAFAQHGGAAVATAPTAVEQKGWKLAVPTELFAVEKVVDGDTIYIRRNNEQQKLRLLSVDTEEKLSNNSTDASKPSTVFGEDCAQWAAEFFKSLAHDGEPSKVGVLFPGGVEERDVYGRLLCYVILPDGRNFNLLLVQLGKSPYFNKYGNSRVCHDAMVAAQTEARAQKLGIWSPDANKPKTPGAPSAKRPYDELLPWWDARAVAVDNYRAKVAADPAHFAAADAPAELERALATSKNEDVSVFGSVDKVFDEKNGDQTVLLRSGSKDKALRIVIPAAARPKLESLDLAHSFQDFKQNNFWVKGRVTTGARGFEMQCVDPASWSLAGPQPAKPAAH